MSNKKDISTQLINNDVSWVEINSRAVEHNLSLYKKAAGNKIIAPVIKGNAYGHGLLKIAQICQKNKDVDWICTATLHEAIELRKNNITKPILVLSPKNTILDQAIIKNISLTAYQYETIQYLHSRGKQIGKKAKIHIKVDTGLSRLGVHLNNAIDLIKQVKTLEFIEIEGVWTHLAESYSQNRSFTNHQVSLFDCLIEQLKNRKTNIPLIHISNSSAATTVTPKYDNFVRIGIGTYGYWASDYVEKTTKKKYPGFELQPALTWKTRILDIKEITAGSFISYDRTYQTKKDSRIAILPVGYFDGYSVALSNKGVVLIRSQYAPIVGKICMNMMMVDVTNIKNAINNDEVTLVGNCSKIRATDMGKIIKANPRHITTKIHPDIPRIIIEKSGS